MGWDPARGPVRIAGLPLGEYVRLTQERPQDIPRWPDELQRVVDDLVRQYDPGGYQLQCPVAGCTWHLLIPRMELDPEPLDVAGEDYVVRAEGVPRADVDLVLGSHIDLHAVCTETGAENVPLAPAPEWARWDLDQLHDAQDEAAALARLDEP